MERFTKSIYSFFLALVLATVLGCAATSTREGAGEYFGDAVITTKVKAAIFNEPSLKSREIHVATLNGAVELAGFVPSQAEMNKAVGVARGVDGVKSVQNDMRIK